MSELTKLTKLTEFFKLTEYLLSMKLPEVIVSKIVYYLLSYGTPCSLIIKNYIGQNMHRLPEHYDDSHKTIWRYRAYSSQYRFIRDSTRSSKYIPYQMDVRYETILALVQNQDCLMSLSPQNVFGELKGFIHFTLKKLFQVRLYALNNNNRDCGTPSAIIIKKHMNELKKKQFEEDFL